MHMTIGARSNTLLHLAPESSDGGAVPHEAARKLGACGHSVCIACKLYCHSYVVQTTLWSFWALSAQNLPTC